jgi:hypothetical protein
MLLAVGLIVESLLLVVVGILLVAGVRVTFRGRGRASAIRRDKMLPGAGVAPRPYPSGTPARADGPAEQVLVIRSHPG